MLQLDHSFQFPSTARPGGRREQKASVNIQHPEVNLRWVKLGPWTGQCLLDPSPTPSHALPLTYQGTRQCCRTSFASRDPHRGCLQTAGACRCVCGHGSHGHRYWSRGSTVTTHPRPRALWREMGSHGLFPSPEAPPCHLKPRPVLSSTHLDTRPSCCRAAAPSEAHCTECCRRMTRRSGCGSASPRRRCWSTRSMGTTPRLLGHLWVQPCSIMGLPCPLPLGGTRFGGPLGRQDLAVG